MTKINYAQIDVDTTGKRPGPWMQTYTGRQFFPLDIRAEDLVIEDIAHALGQLCRYNGHTNDFYSVAEHCVLMTRHAMNLGWPRATLRAVLMHDAAEAYIGDYPQAVKRVILGIKELEGRIEAVLAEKFDLDQSEETKAQIKELDRRIVLNERLALMPGVHPWMADAYEPLDVIILCWSPRKATQRFMQTYRYVKERTA